MTDRGCLAVILTAIVLALLLSGVAVYRYQQECRARPGSAYTLEDSLRVHLDMGDHCR